MVPLGGATTGVTVRATAFDTTFPARELIWTRKVAPLSATTVAGMMYEADWAPGMSVPLRCHW